MPTLAPNSASILAESVLASSLSAADLAQLEALGEVVSVPSGEVIFAEGAPSEHLHVVLDGAALPAMPGGQLPSYWVGPGDVCGETGFALGTPRTATMTAFGPDPRFFRIHRDALDHVGDARGVALTRLLGTLGRVRAARLDAPSPGADTRTEADYCDHTHPGVVALARQLERRTPLESACSIWAAMWKIPYRFGSWQWTASEMLTRGHGMCTTKAVLQVALMRALGIQGGYVRGELLGPLVRACMPRAYHPRFQRPTFKHYYAAARIEGRWVPLDASYSVGSLSLIAETEAYVKPWVQWDAMVEGFAHGAASLGGTDPYDIEVHEDLTEVMRKKPTYDPKNADAMNVLLDRAQGFVPAAPAYVTRAEEALREGAPRAARSAVIEGLAAHAGVSCPVAAGGGHETAGARYTADAPSALSS